MKEVEVYIDEIIELIDDGLTTAEAINTICGTYQLTDPEIEYIKNDLAVILSEMMDS